MAPLAVHIKHAGKSYDVQLDPDLPPAAFKLAVYQLTGVPPDRMKVMIKGGMLKVTLSLSFAYSGSDATLLCVQDDTDWKKVAPKVVGHVLSRVCVLLTALDPGPNVHRNRCCGRAAKAPGETYRVPRG